MVGCGGMTTQYFYSSSKLFRVTYLGLSLTLLGTPACKSKPKPTDSKLAASVAASSVPARTPQEIASAIAARTLIVPKGPAFVIEAGKGLGPVRFGATVATIERLMGSKCDELTEKLCRYIPAAIEFELADGVASGMVVYRHDRPVPGSPGKVWGRTQCAIAPDITPRVILSYVHSKLGKPVSSEEVKTENPNRTALRETYPGLVLEYDRGERTQDLMLGSIRVIKMDKPAPKP